MGCRDLGSVPGAAPPDLQPPLLGLPGCRPETPYCPAPPQQSHGLQERCTPPARLPAPLSLSARRVVRNSGIFPCHASSYKPTSSTHTIVILLPLLLSLLLHILVAFLVTLPRSVEYELEAAEFGLCQPAREEDSVRRQRKRGPEGSTEC